MDTLPKLLFTIFLLTMVIGALVMMLLDLLLSICSLVVAHAKYIRFLIKDDADGAKNHRALINDIRHRWSISVLITQFTPIKFILSALTNEASKKRLASTSNVETDNKKYEGYSSSTPDEIINMNNDAADIKESA